MRGELLPPIRVLVLELHARRPERVSLSGFRHPLLFERPRCRFGLGDELRPSLRRRAITAARDHQRQSARRIRETKVKRRERPHRKTHNVSLVDLQRIEHGPNVVAGTLLRILGKILRYVRRRITPRVECDAAIAVAKMLHLHLVRTTVAGKFVRKDDRGARACVLVIELDPVV